MLAGLRDRGFDVMVRNHAEAILTQDFPEDLAALARVLGAFDIALSELIGGGGGESGQTQRLRQTLTAEGWPKHNFSVQTIVDGAVREAVGHEIDHVRHAAAGVLALEIEWNNKDPFFDRDLDSFQRLHAQSAISVGIVVTRGRSMQDAFVLRIAGWLDARGAESEGDLDRLGITARSSRQMAQVAAQTARGVAFPQAFARMFVADKFGQATTHWAKLEARVARGVGNPCPLLLIGLPAGLLHDGEARALPPVDAPWPDLFDRPDG